jgi:hypothetical protein
MGTTIGPISGAAVVVIDLDQQLYHVFRADER